MMMKKHVRWMSVLLTLTMVCGLIWPRQEAIAAGDAGRFSDVPQGHWADGVIHELRGLGISDGIGDNQFGLGQTITRGEFVAFLVKLMAWTPVTPATGSFSDNQDPAAWYYGAVETAAAHGALVAAGGACRPDAPITREEMADLMIGALGFRDLAGQLKNADSGFADVTSHQGIITMAKDFGLIGGMGDGTFMPQSTATREQAAAMMVRLYHLNQQQIDQLHGFYAIASASQSQLMGQMDSVSFGWSRLQLDNGTVRLNTTMANQNEFAVPSGFADPVNQVKGQGATAQLMVYADNTTTTAAGSLLSVVLADPILRQQAIAAILSQGQATTKDGVTVSFDGVVIDFEALKGDKLRQDFNSFLRELQPQLAANGQKLYVMVHPTRVGQAYYDGYDYRTIGQLADQVIVMASDYYAKSLTQAEMDAGYTKTPLSPLNEVYVALAAITDPATGVQDHAKIWLQISMDAVQWKLQAGKVINQTPYHPTYAAIAQRLASGGVTDHYPNYSYNPYATYHDATDGTDNVLWYEDSRSVRAKMDLARMFGIQGISLWRLGNIPDQGGNNLDVWQSVTEMVK